MIKLDSYNKIERLMTLSNTKSNTEQIQIVFTGKRDKLVMEKSKSQGYDIHNSVTSKTSYLICDDVNVTKKKKKKARDVKGCLILNYKDFSKILE